MKNKADIIDDKIQRRLDIQSQIDEVQDFANKVQAKTENEQVELYEKVLKKLKPKIIGWLVQNYNKSGINTRTGTLLTNIRNSNIEMRFKGKNEKRMPKIYIEMPKSPKLYRNRSKEETYKAAGALNSGYVRSSADLKDSTKKRLKKGKKFTAKGVSFEEGKGEVSRLKGGSTGEVEIVKVSVVNAKEYYMLTKQQVNQLSRMITKEIEKSL